MQVSKLNKFVNVCYDICGLVFKYVKCLEEEGYCIFKLNIGNLVLFGFEVFEEIFQDVICNLLIVQGYSDFKGLFSVCKVVMQYYQQKQVEGVGIEDIYFGNGVLELIVMFMQVLLNNGDEVLIFVFDYLLWIVVVSFVGGKLVYYLCDEQVNWWLDLEDIKVKIMLNIRVMVIINLNNFIGVVYFREVLEGMVELVCQYNLVLFFDEIYDKIFYDGVVYVFIVLLVLDVFCLIFNGLFKFYWVVGFCFGWVVIFGFKQWVQSYIEGFDIFVNMCLCVNVLVQYVIQIVLGGYQSINDLVLLLGCLLEQCNCVWELFNDIFGVSCVKLMGVLYVFLWIDLKVCLIYNDEKFVFDLLFLEKLLIVQGIVFNWLWFDYFWVVILFCVDDLEQVILCIGSFFKGYQQ